MGVRERDDTGWDELPGGLSFSDDDVELDDEPPRRRFGTVVWLMVLALLLGAGAAAGARWYGQADVRDVLASSTATYGQVLHELRLAPDAEALAAAAARAPGAADDIEDDLARLESDDGRLRRAVVAQLTAERDVLLAIGALDEVDRAPLRVWGDAHDALSEAVADEERARSALIVADSGAARRLPDTPAVVRRISSTVGEAVVGDVARSAGDLLADLGAAQKTADLRTVAERAEGQRSAVVAAQEGLQGNGDGAVLAGFGSALQSVAELRSLTPAETSVWPAVRTRLEDSLRIVANADASLEAGAVRGQLPLVLASIDGVVARAEEAHAAWQPVHDAAVAAQAADVAVLRTHAERVRAVAAGWPALRTAVEALQAQQQLERGAVADVAVDADALRAALADATTPPGVEAGHAGLLAALDAVRTPLQLAAAEPDCPDCPDADVPVTDGVGQAAAALPGWDPAFEAWTAALAAADAAVANRALPPPPDA